MTDSGNKQMKTAASHPVAPARQPNTASQDQMWQKFDAMLQEFLKMEQNSPAVEKQPVRTAR
jgi:hypothetical protein